MSIANDLFDILQRVKYPRVVAWTDLRGNVWVGESEADGREIKLPHGNLVLPLGAVVRDATQAEACAYYSQREATERGLSEWYGNRPNVCD